MLFEFDKTPWLDNFLLEMNGCVKDYKEEWQWFRYSVGGKLFAACLKPDLKYGT